MGLFLVTFGVMVLAVAGMAIGVMFGLSPIAGSCGGLNAVDGSGSCQSCSRPCKSRKPLKGAESSSPSPSDSHPLTRADTLVNRKNESL